MNENRMNVDIRPGVDPDKRNTNQREASYPGKPPADDNYPAQPTNSSIRNVRIGDLGPGFGSSALGPMELAGKMTTPTKVPPMVKYESKPITGAGPIEMQRLEQQQSNAIAMGDPDYAPLRELDYESVKDANFSKVGKSAQRPDKDFTK